MSADQRVVNVVAAGLGGQGVLKASDILAEAAFLAGYDVKKADVHGMSQRGGFVTSDVRFGPKVLSPMVSRGEADFLLLLEPAQKEAAEIYLRQEGGVLLQTEDLDVSILPTKNALNVALLGMLSCHLDLPERFWQEAIKKNLAEHHWEANIKAFAVGREVEKTKTGGENV